MRRRAAACAALLLVAAAAGAQPAAERTPFLLAPVVEGVLACGNAASTQKVAADSYCAAHGADAARAVAQLLDELEPGGARGEVQVGYVLTIQLLGLYRADGAGGWVLDEATVQRLLRIVREVPRPVVLYLAANHFDTDGPLPAALMRDPRNLMTLADGQPPRLDYFGYTIAPFTLSTDEAVPVNRLRFEALRVLLRRAAALPPPVRERVAAIALGGEIHHLFADFSGGMGRYENLQVTDYSPASQAAFRAWLARKYGSLEQLNAAMGTNWRNFDEVRAPSASALRDAALPRIAHYDGYAGGKVPVSGWLWDPEGHVQGLELLVDGERRAAIGRGFNRLDVYRAVAGITDPNVGFRTDLDVSQWPPGTYRLQVIARTATGTQELAQRPLVVAGAKPSKLHTAWLRIAHRLRRLWQADLQPLRGVQAALDQPAWAQRVLFNPLARDWDEFRAHQVQAYMQHLFDLARGTGWPAGKLYSHQILARVNSSWNPHLFATDGSVGSGLPWKQGFNTYGGAAGGDWVRQFVQEGRIAGYGVPEFHPQQWKRPGVALQALQLHRRLGARFVSPYYLSIASDRAATAGQAVKALEIRPNNRLEGSDMLYQAIRTLAAQ